jgi:glycosyltransferase involved in cell wall biosynthesis
MYSSQKLITVLTATYNRAHLLPDLYRSLCRQSYPAFDWLIVDDGSSDETETLASKWREDTTSFQIRYIRKENGGKNRAINEGVLLVETPFTMIVDSDDYLTDDAVDFLSKAASEIVNEEMIAGVAALRGTDAGTPLLNPDIPAGQFILASNLERARYRLNRDACEVFKTNILRSHPFEVWPGEKFVPEEVVWNSLALEGYRLKWFSKVTCIVRYQDNGLMGTSVLLQKNNPMGYARLFKHRATLAKSFRQRFYWNSQLFAQCFLGHHPGFGLKDNVSLCSLLSLPIGGALAIRRYYQFKN